MNSIIRNWINGTGEALSIGAFMRLCLNHPRHGYYNRAALSDLTAKSMNKPSLESSSPVIGKKGDFITSPEISQIFGEMIGVWLCSSALAGLKKFRLVELGPGRGSLLCDILRTFNQLKQLDKLSGIQLVESSQSMRRQQFESLSLMGNSLYDQVDELPLNEAIMEFYRKNVPVKWSENVAEIEYGSGGDEGIVILAHEFFDAMPIHQLIKSDDGQWREVLVDCAQETDSARVSADLDFRFVLSKDETVPLKTFKQLHAHLSFDADPVGQVYEWSPESGHLLQSILQQISNRPGLLLVMDYGCLENAPNPGQSFRGIRQHRFVHPLSEPGLTDLTADVDFASFTRIRNGFKNEHGQPSFIPLSTMTQAQFLESMGARIRLQQLLQSCRTAEERQSLVESYERLVGISNKSGKMGSIYKFWAAKTSSLQSLPSYPFPTN